MHAKEMARQRAEVIMKVRSGQLTVKAAAALLGVSRKTYYEWEARGLGAMLQQLEDQEAGRPASPPSPEAAALQAKVAALEQELNIAKQTAEIRAVLLAMEQKAAKKKRPKSPSSSP
jgi:transposase-like protein